MKKTRLAITGFAYGKRPWAKEHEQLLEVGKCGKTDSPLALSKGMQLCWPILQFCFSEPLIANLYCFKAFSLWGSVTTAQKTNTEGVVGSKHHAWPGLMALGGWVVATCHTASQRPGLSPCRWPFLDRLTLILPLTNISNSNVKLHGLNLLWCHNCISSLPPQVSWLPATSALLLIRLHTRTSLVTGRNTWVPGEGWLFLFSLLFLVSVYHLMYQV